MSELHEKILIVDDNRMNIAAVRASLKGLDSNHKLLEAETATEGIRLAKNELPDLILLDIRLPDKDGFEVARVLKSNKATAHIPIIYISGLDDVDSKLRGFTSGGVDYIIKPFYRQEVLARVKTQLKIHRLQQSLETRNREINESIGYAKRIQEAFLPSQEIMKKLFPSHFVFYKPKDVLSGDLYWVREYHGDVMVACIDCTGHGIPGALISLVGINLLNRAAGVEADKSPAEILHEVDKRLIDSLHQNGENGNSQDGMDIALCRIDKSRRKVTFSGAYRPLIQVSNGNIKEWKGDKYPVGGTQQKKKDFSNQEITPSLRISWATLLITPIRSCSLPDG